MKNILTQDEINHIINICEKYYITNYHINSDGSIDVDGSVFLGYNEFNVLPLKFNKVTGLFHCGRNSLTTLEGCPREVGDAFICNANGLTSLYGAPLSVGGDFVFVNNIINTLEHCPPLNGVYDFNGNKLPNIVMERLLIPDNNEMINIFLKYQNHCEVWTPEFNREKFDDLVMEISEGLR